ncbi:MAG: NAD-dependent epimerase/dehydratase family protein [Chitinophagaceae bacterium]|nr:NAD-dependent epimerase/dehydratase family protein [Chitinophagaceae bacterium]
MTSHKNILLTGSAGLVGQSVAEALTQKNIEFIGTYNQYNENITWPAIKVNLGKDDLQMLLAGYSFDTIIHCAGKIPDGINTYEECYLRNGQIDDSVFEYATGNGVKKFIFISTTNVYGFTDRLITEDSEPIVENLYSKRKLETESKLLNQNNFRSIILRINAPYGNYQKSNTVLKIFVEKAFGKRSYQISWHGLPATGFYICK